MGVGAFDGRTALVTGAAHGIGLATSIGFARQGASVCLFDIDENRLAEASAQVEEHNGGRAFAVAGDVRDRGDVRRALRACEARFSGVDVLLNNAGYARSRTTIAISEESWDEVVGVCLTGAFRVAQEVARSMSTRGGGVILNACASSAVASEPGLASYAAAKAGLLALTKAMAIDLAPAGVRVVTVLPGEINTHPWPNVELRRLYEARIAAGRSGRPDEIAAAYLYLASDDARRLNGVALTVDGGMLAWE